MNRSYFVATLAALPFCTFAIAATAPQYTLIDLGETEYIGQGMIWADRTIEDINGFVPTPAPCTLGNHNFQFTPVLMSGQSFISVGSGCTTNGSHAVKWTNTENVEGTVLTDVGVLPGALEDSSAAIGANEVGDVVGESATAFNGAFTRVATHAFLWNSGNMTDLGVIAGPNYTSKAVAVNDSHEVIGVSDAISTTTGEILNRAFVYTNGKMYNLTFFTTGGPSALLEDARWIDCQGNIAAVGRPASQPAIRHSYLLVRQGPPRTCRQF
jgi:probable HAF family extracellular repeat protein